MRVIAGSSLKSWANADLAINVCYERPEFLCCTMFTSIEALLRGLKDLHSQCIRAFHPEAHPQVQMLTYWKG